MQKNIEYKAYAVMDNYEGYGCIVFAKHNIVAHRKGAQELGCEFSDIASCRRAPEFDQYAPGPVSNEVLYANGWWFECVHCGDRVDDSDENSAGEEIDAIFEGQLVFCNVKCCKAHHDDLASRRLAKEAAKSAAIEKWPGINIRHLSDPWKDHPVEVTFTYPGGTAAAIWRHGDERVSIIKADIPAWESFTGKPATF